MGPGQKVLGGMAGRPLIYCGSKVKLRLGQGPYLVEIAPGQKHPGWVGSGKPSMVWVWKISPKNVKFFNFFPSGRVKK